MLYGRYVFPPLSCIFCVTRIARWWVFAWAFLISPCCAVGVHCAFGVVSPDRASNTHFGHTFQGHPDAAGSPVASGVAQASVRGPDLRGADLRMATGGATGECDVGDGADAGSYTIVAVLEHVRPQRRYWDPAGSRYVHELAQRWVFDAGAGSTIVYFRAGQTWWCAADSLVYPVAEPPKRASAIVVARGTYDPPPTTVAPSLPDQVMIHAPLWMERILDASPVELDRGKVWDFLTGTDDAAQLPKEVTRDQRGALLFMYLQSINGTQLPAGPAGP